MVLARFGGTLRDALRKTPPLGSILDSTADILKQKKIY
jgi:hypothetical protein